jgi:hypothetical protein
MDKKEVKDKKYNISEILGEYLVRLKILDYLLSINSKRCYNIVLDTINDKRVRVTIAILLYGSTLLFVMENKELIFQPYVRLPDGTYLQGSCDFIKEEYKTYRNLVTTLNSKAYVTPEEMTEFRVNWSKRLDDDYTYNATELPPLPICKNNTVVVEKVVVVNQTIECSPCPACTVCPVCPKLGTLTQTQNDWLLNHCQLKDGASCYQSGSADTCDEALEFFQVPGRPKYKSRPSTSYYSGYNQPPAETVNFKLIEAGREDKGFMLNNSIWFVSGNGSMLWVHKK